MTETATEQAQTFRCEACGANITYDPGAAALKCAHCGHEQAIEQQSGAEIKEYDFRTALESMPTVAASSLVESGKEIECRSCGARVVTAGQATRCPYCDSPMVVPAEAEEANVLKPESLLPFEVSREQALADFRAWLKSRWFAPNDLKKRAHAEVIDGVYVPYFTYDSDTETKYTGQRGDDYQTTESYTDANGRTQTRTVTHTNWTWTSGTVDVPFDDVLVCASSRLPRPLVRALEPWDLSALTPYAPAFLSGFSAERYSVDLADGLGLAKDRMLPVIRDAIRHDIGGDRQQIWGLVVKHRHVTFKHLLLPLWISAFRYRERAYRFFINARTGEVQGERPWSTIKIGLAVFVAMVVIVAFAMLFTRH